MSKALGRWRSALNGSRSSWTPINQVVPRPCLRLVSQGQSFHQKRTYTAVQAHSEPTSSRSSLLSKLPDAPRLAEHLNSVFAPLQFPPELAARILTHSSHVDAAKANNMRMSFLGRRVLNTYLLLFLHSSPALKSKHDYDQTLENTLNTYTLGEHVAPKWGLGNVLKWRPVESSSRNVGLWKVQGTTVEAVMGGIFHQFGGAVAHKVFHTRLLPHILLPGKIQGLHDAFHAHAMEVCEKMGGLEADLSIPNLETAPTQVEATTVETSAS